MAASKMASSARAGFAGSVLVETFCRPAAAEPRRRATRDAPRFLRSVVVMAAVGSFADE